MGWRPASCCPRRSPSLLPVLTRGAPSYPPGLAALRRAPAVLRGLRLARSPLAIASRRPRLAPNPGYCLPARSAAPLFPPTARRLSVSSLPPLAPPAGWSAVLCAASPSPRLPPGSPSAVWHRRLCLRLSVPSLPPLLPAGWAAASVSDSLCPRFPLSSCRMGCCLCLRLSVPSLPPLLLPDGLPPLSPTLCAVASPSPPAGWAAASASDHLDRLLSVPSPPHPLMPDGMSSSEPRSVRADVIPGSERSAATATRQRGGGARRVDRGRGARPQFGRAAEPARSAARASPGHPSPHSVRALYPRPLSPPAWGGRRPPTSVNPAMTPAGRLGGGVCSPAKRIFVDEPQGQSAHSNAPSKKKRAPIHIGARRIY